jgi:hypothetical protein
MRGSWRIAGVLLGGLLSCSSTTTENLPNAPQIWISPSAQAFGTDVGFGTYIGAAGFGAFQIQNKGKETLIISAVTKGGDSAFTFIGPNLVDLTADGGIVESKATTYISVTFKPTQPKMYSGTLTIKSNAAGGELISTDGGTIQPTDPTSIDIPLSGMGVLPPPDGGVDGG